MLNNVLAQDIEEVVVTATKLNKKIEDIGASVSIVSGQLLSAYDGAEELSQQLSGVQAAVANGTQVAFQIRGIGAVDHQALTPTATAVYRDGVYMASNVQTSPLLFDIDRAEVLKGPQGSLYGRNASAGSINFVSIRPSDDTTGYIEGGFGRFNRISINGAFNTPISEKLSVRLSGRLFSQDPTLDNIITNEDISAPENAGGVRDEFGLRAMAAYKASPATDILFSVHYAEDNGINAAPLNSSLTEGATPLESHKISIGSDGVQDTDNEFYGTSVELNHQFGNYSLVVLGAVEGYNQQYGFDFDGTPAPFGVASLNANLAYDRDFSQYSIESRLNYSSDTVEVMAGVYFDSEDFDQEYLIWCGELDPNSLLGTCRYVGAPGRTGSNPASTGTATSLLSVVEQARSTAALFTYNTIALSPRLDVVIGARLTYENIKGNGEGLHIFDDGTVALNNRDDLGAAAGSNEISENHLTGNFGLNYTLNDNAMLYASYSTGFKSGGFNGEVINNATHFTDEGLFEAETVNAVEAGLKVTKENLRYTLAVFYQNYDKPQARIFVPFTVDGGGSFTSNSLSNLDKATSKGAEFEVNWSPISGLNLGGGFTYLDTEINQNINPNVPQNAETFDGNPLPFASKYSTTLSAKYQWAPRHNIQASLAANAKHQSAFYLDAEGLENRKQDGYSIIDVTAKLDFDTGMSVKLWGRNLGNSAYAVSGFGFIGYNTFLGAPRTYGISLAYTY